MIDTITHQIIASWKSESNNDKLRKKPGRTISTNIRLYASLDNQFDQSFCIYHKSFLKTFFFLSNCQFQSQIAT